MKEVLPSLIIVLIFVSIHLFSNKIRFLHVLPRSKWLSASGGISIAYVFIILLPELSAIQQDFEETNFLNFIRNHSYLLALLGLCSFYSLERMAKSNKLKESKNTDFGTFWIHIISFALFNALIGYALVQTQENSLDFILFAIAMGFHFVTNDYGLYLHHSHTYLKKGRWVVAFFTFIGFLIGFLYDLPKNSLAFVFSFLAGGIILNVLKEELPEERESNYIAFWMGVILFSALVMFNSDYIKSIIRF
jgi:zinc transporter ZupT